MKKTKEAKPQFRRVARFTLFAPDGSMHKHEREFPYLPANALDSVFDDLIAKWGDGQGQISVAKYVAFEKRPIEERAGKELAKQLEGAA